MDESDWTERAYRVAVLTVYGVLFGVYLWTVADQLSDGDLHRWAERRAVMARKRISEARGRARMERETMLAANRVIFEAMQIVEGAAQ